MPNSRLTIQWGAPGSSPQVWALRQADALAGSNTTDLISITDWSGNPFSGASPWTIEGWTRCQRQLQSWARVFDAGGPAGAYQTVFWGGNGAVTTSYSSLNPSAVYPDLWADSGDQDGTNWVHMAMTYDPTIGTYGQLNYYKNGVDLEDPHNPNNTVAIGKEWIRLLGTDLDTGRAYCDIFDVRVWDFARSESAIAGDYDTILNGDESGLVCYLRMNDGSGTTLEDETGNTEGVIDNTTSKITWISITDPR